MTEVEESFGYLDSTFTLLEEYVGEYYYDYFTLEYGNYYGMESSGVIYCSEDISEGTVVHEVIHQWFYSMIGNDQSDESFLEDFLCFLPPSWLNLALKLSSLDLKEFCDGLRDMKINITNQEQHALYRRFDINNDGKISMEEFYNTLAR